MKQIPQKKNFVLFLECFDHKDQAVLNRWAQGKISDREFLKTVDWHQRWGFPWENYRPLLKWCQRHQIPMIAINDSQLEDLRKRDILAANLIAEYRKKESEKLFVIVDGDMHLAKKHLPSELEKKLGADFENQNVRVFQNIDDIYFQMIRQGIENHVDVIKFQKNVYSLQSVPPWVKWHNYLMFLEKKYDPQFEDGEDGIDYSDHVHQFVKILAHDLEIQNIPESYSIYTMDEDELWGRLESLDSQEQKKWFEAMIQEGESFYLPEQQWGYLAQTSVNHAASLAMLILYADWSGWKKWPMKMPQDFIALIWVETIGYLGSKFINHKRKTDTLADVKASFLAQETQDQGREAFKLTLSQKMKEFMFLQSGKRSKDSFRPRRKQSYRQSARLLGGMLGEKLYHGYHKNLLSLENLKRLLKKNVQMEKFEEYYFESIEWIDSLPEPFRSKKEKL